MKQATLCFLIRDSNPPATLPPKRASINGERELLLAMKKKGFGEGKWNGVGGKFDSEKDKDISDTAIREMKEEIGVKIRNPEKMAILNFSYPYLANDEEKEWQVHVFFAKKWEGEPKESKEMKPEWFKINEIPFDEMWPDDKFWLPKVLNGEKLKAKFIFKPGELLDSYEIQAI